jgi:hypothetical protein
MSEVADAQEREEARRRLLDAVCRLGYPVELGEMLADELRGPWSMNRMTGYLLGERPHDMGQIADELLAITQQRDRIAEQKRSEHANASITAFYNRPRDDEE